MASNRAKLETPEYKARLLVFSERLKKEREKLGITQGALAERAGLSGHAVISRWEAVADERRGGDYITSGAVARELPDVNDMLKLCELFGCEIDYLVGIQDFPTKGLTDICHKTALAPEAVEVLELIAYNKGFDEIIAIDELSLNDYALKAINHLIANNYGILGTIGVYMFGEFEGLERVKVKGARVNIAETDKHTRNGLLSKISNDLSNYRNKLLENGGDIPLTLVMDAKRVADEESRIKHSKGELKSTRRARLDTASEKE